MFSKKGLEASCHRASGKTRVKPELSTVGIKRYFALKVYNQLTKTPSVIILSSDFKSL